MNKNKKKVLTKEFRSDTSKIINEIQIFWIFIFKICVLNRCLNRCLKEDFMRRRKTDNNDGFIKSYEKKKMEIQRDFTAFVIHDELKYIVFNNKPVLGGYGKLFEHYEKNGFKIKGIHLKSKHIEEKLSIGGAEHGRIQEEYMSRVQLLKKGNAYMTTKTVVDRRINFSDQLMLIRSKHDLTNIQKACINAQVGWVLMKRLVIEHIETGREIMNILNEVKKLENVHNQELYTAFVEKANGAIASIDRFTPNNLSFLIDGNCHNVYDYLCKKDIKTGEYTTISCQGQGLFLDNLR